MRTPCLLITLACGAFRRRPATPVRKLATAPNTPRIPVGGCSEAAHRLTCSASNALTAEPAQPRRLMDPARMRSGLVGGRTSSSGHIQRDDHLQQARADAISHRQTPVPTRFEASSQQGLVEPCSPGHASHSHAIGQLYLTGQRPALAARAPSETRLDNSRPPSLSRPMLGPIINGMVDPSITTPCPRSAPTPPGLLASDKSPKSRVPGHSRPRLTDPIRLGMDPSQA